MEAVAVLHMSYIVLSSDNDVTTGCCCGKDEDEIETSFIQKHRYHF